AARVRARWAGGEDRGLTGAAGQLGLAVYGDALGVLGEWTAAQDVAQDVFVELWSHPDRYDPAAGSLRTYLTVLARRRAIDVVRSELRRIARPERNHRLTPPQGLASPRAEVEAAEAAG